MEAPFNVDGIMSREVEKAGRRAGEQAENERRKAKDQKPKTKLLLETRNEKLSTVQ
jgi:hypothetical protein